MRRSVGITAILGVLVTAIAIAVPVALAKASKASTTTITLYSGQHEETVSALVAAFEQQTGINVKIRSDDEGLLVSQIIQEGKKSPADVFMTENSPPLEELQDRGLLATVNASTLKLTSARLSSPQGKWEGVSARVSTMVYNTDDLKVSQLPKSVLELAAPEWKGKLALAPGETDFQPIVTAVAAKYGKARAVKWLDGIKANAAGHVYPDNETLVTEVNSGRAQLGVINHYYWFRMKDELGASKIHSAEHFFANGDPGYVIDVAGAGALASSAHPAEAQQFLAFLVSKAGQEILAHDESYEYPLGSGVKTAKPLVPFGTLKPDPITVAQLGDGARAIALLRDASLL